MFVLASKHMFIIAFTGYILATDLCLSWPKVLNHKLWSRGGEGSRPHFLAWGGRGAHHFELQPLVCVVCSGKVITLTQQCISQVTKVTTNSQHDP